MAKLDRLRVASVLSIGQQEGCAVTCTESKQNTFSRCGQKETIGERPTACIKMW